MVISKESKRQYGGRHRAAVKETLNDPHPRPPVGPGLSYYIYFRAVVLDIELASKHWVPPACGEACSPLGVLFFFLRRYRTTFIIAASIPASILVTFTVMYFVNTGYGILSLNLISLMGLMLGIGMLVDNAVVVLENIVRLRRMGMDPVKASIQGARAKYRWPSAPPR